LSQSPASAQSLKDGAVCLRPTNVSIACIGAKSERFWMSPRTPCY